jgi:hypothetical protein
MYNVQLSCLSVLLLLKVTELYAGLYRAMLLYLLEDPASVLHLATSGVMLFLGLCGLCGVLAIRYLAPARSETEYGGCAPCKCCEAYEDDDSVLDSDDDADVDSVYMYAINS